MATVRQRYQDEPFERMLKRFRHLVQYERILAKYKEKSYYVKPSMRRRIKQRLAAQRRRKYQQR